MKFSKEYLVKHYIELNKSSRQIAKETSSDQKTVLKHLHYYEIPVRTNQTRKQLQGNEYGQLIVKRRVEKGYDGCFWWECECSCGKMEKISSYKLTKGKRYACNSCTRKINAKKMSTGCGEVSGRYLRQVRCGAIRRGLEFDITVAYMWEVFQRQNGCCALSGMKLILEIGTSERTASLDRIDSKVGYTSSNIQWVHKDINKMKQEFKEERFVELCRAVVYNINNGEDEK